MHVLFRKYSNFPHSMPTKGEETKNALTRMHRKASFVTVSRECNTSPRMGMLLDVLIHRLGGSEVW